MKGVLDAWMYQRIYVRSRAEKMSIRHGHRGYLLVSKLIPWTFLHPPDFDPRLLSVSYQFLPFSLSPSLSSFSSFSSPSLHCLSHWRQQAFRERINCHYQFSQSRLLWHVFDTYLVHKPTERKSKEAMISSRENSMSRSLYSHHLFVSSHTNWIHLLISLYVLQPSVNVWYRRFPKISGS